MAYSSEAVLKMLKEAKRSQESTGTAPYKYDPVKQVKGYTTRLEGAGVDVKKTTDDRNFVEKLFNLNQKQGFLPDLFEVIDRPLNAWAAFLVGENAWESFTGNSEQEYTYVDVLKKWGLDNTTAAIVGTVGNIFGDPVDLIMLIGGAVVTVYSGGTTAPGYAAIIAKYIAEFSDALGDVSKAAKIVDDAQDLMQTSKFVFNNADDVINFFRKAGLEIKTADALKVMNDLNKATEAATRAKELAAAWKNLYKLPTKKVLDNYNILGKAVQYGKTALSPIAIYNKYKDIGRAAMFGRTGVLFGRIGKVTYEGTKDALSYLDKITKGAINYNAIRSIKNGVVNAADEGKRLLNIFSEVAASAFEKLDNVSRSLMGDKFLIAQQEFAKALKGTFADAKTLDEAVAMVIEKWKTAPPNDVIKALVSKGDAEVKNVINTILETGIYKADNFENLLNRVARNQERQHGFYIDDKGIRRMSADADTSIHITGTDGVTKNIKKYSGAKDVDVTKFQRFGERAEAIKAPGSKAFGEVIDDIGDKGTPASKLTRNAALKIEKNFKNIIGEDQNYSFIINKFNDNKVAGDLEVWFHNLKEDGTVEHVLMYRLEVKSTNSFILGQGTLEESIDDELMQIFKQGTYAAAQLHDKKGRLEVLTEYLKKHDNIVFVPNDTDMFLLNATDLMALADENYVNNVLSYIARPGDIKKGLRRDEGYRIITKNPITGKIEVSDIKRTYKKIGIGVTADINEDDYPDMIGLISEGNYRRYFINQVTFKSRKGELKKFLASKLEKYRLNLEQTSLLEMMEKTKDGAREFFLNAASRKKLIEIMNSNPLMKQVFDPETMMRAIPNFGKGDVAYELVNDEAFDNLANLLKKLDAKENKSLRDALGVLMDRPDFFGGDFMRQMQAVNDTEEMLALRGAYISFMDGVKKRIDNIGSMKTDFYKAFGENYVRHSVNTDLLTQAEKYLAPEHSKFLGVLKSKIYDLQERRYNMTIFEANNIINSKLRAGLGEEVYGNLIKNLGTEQIEMFTIDIGKSAMDFYSTAFDIKKESLLLNEIVTSDLFTFQDAKNKFPLIRPSEPGSSKLGYVVIPRKQFTDNALHISKYMDKETGTAFQKRMSDFLAKVGGDPDNILIDTNLYAMVGKLAKPDETLAPAIKLLDWANDTFKKTKLLTPGFQLRNLVGNFLNIALSGLSTSEISDLTVSSGRYFMLGTKGEELIRKAAVVGFDNLSDIEKADHELFTAFVKSGFLNTSFGLNEMEGLLDKGSVLKNKSLKKAFDSVAGFSAASNEAIDRMYRLALFDLARKNPVIFQRAGFQDAAQYVRFVLFDPKDLSQFEKNVMRRVIPFYTFTKKNLMYQLQNITKNPVKYRNINRILEGAYDLVESSPEEVPEYQVENMYVPIPFTNKDGEFTTFKANLPQSDLNEWAKNPLRRLLSGLTPVLRMPYEMVTNTQIYTGLPISEFKGQKGYKIPELDRWGEYYLSQTGVDAPISAARSLATGDITGSLGFTKTNLEKSATSKAYDELKQLRDLMSYYKQQGVRIPTIAELENQTEINRMQLVLNALAK